MLHSIPLTLKDLRDIFTVGLLGALSNFWLCAVIGDKEKIYDPGMNALLSSH
jgi:hypothetical protein